MYKTSQPKEKGEISEVCILAELIKNGYVVSVPYGDNQRYDLIVEGKDKILKKIQCKTGRLREGGINFNAFSTRINSKGFVSTDYKGQIDYFAVYCLEINKIFIVPVEEASKREVRLWLEAKRDKSIKRWARDYELTEDYVF